MSKEKKEEYALEYILVVRPMYIANAAKLRDMMYYGTKHPEARTEEFLNEFRELARLCMDLKKYMDELGQKFLDESDDD